MLVIQTDLISDSRKEKVHVSFNLVYENFWFQLYVCKIYSYKIIKFSAISQSITVTAHLKMYPHHLEDLLYSLEILAQFFSPPSVTPPMSESSELVKEDRRGNSISDGQ